MKAPPNPHLQNCEKCGEKIIRDGEIRWWIQISHYIYCKKCYNKIVERSSADDKSLKAKIKI